MSYKSMNGHVKQIYQKWEDMFFFFFFFFFIIIIIIYLNKSKWQKNVANLLET